MSRHAATEPGRRARGDSVRSGYSLIETLVALVMMSVLIAMGVPRFQLSLEQARANVAGANLRSIWSAERLYWLQNRGYEADLDGGSNSQIWSIRRWLRRRRPMLTV